MKEYNTIIEREVWQLIRENEVLRNKRIIDIRWVYNRKRNKDGVIALYKAYLVAHGFRQTIDYLDTYAVVCNITTVRALFAIVAYLDLEINQGDAITAYLYTNNLKLVYIRQLEGFTKLGFVYRVDKVIYSLKILVKDWY
jgi:hypothetical protein